MNHAQLDREFFAELSAFSVNAHKEGFSFKPSRIVKDKSYCHNVLTILANKGSVALNASAISIISKCRNLPVEHDITKPASLNPPQAASLTD